MNHTSDDGFLFTFPLFSYLIEPGPKPGYLREPATKTVFVPLWTDEDLFGTYLQASGLAGRVSGLQLQDGGELAVYLRSVPDTIKHAMIDPAAKAPQVTRLYNIAKLLEYLERPQDHRP